jgi:putative RNA 2'-phosphotransferase
MTDDPIKEMRSFRPRGGVGGDPMGLNSRKADKAGLFLCLVLRHKPSAAHVTADAQGWVDIAALIAGSQGRLTRPIIEEIVATNNKQRFAISEDGKKIRAKQGHSIPIDLQLEPVIPPDVLYHGTYPGAVPSIGREGLNKMQRHHVHMAEDTTTATSVGMRKGAPVVFIVNAKAMHAAGFKFYRSENGVWLADRVPPEFLKVRTNEP